MTTLEHAIGTGVYENDEFTTAGAVTITLDFRADGADNANSRFFNLGKFAHTVQIIPSDDITITRINGRTFKSAKTVGTNGITINKTGIIVLVTTGAVNIKVFAKA